MAQIVYIPSMPLLTSSPTQDLNTCFSIRGNQLTMLHHLIVVNTNAAQDPPTSATLGTALNTPGKSFMDIGFINLNTLTITSTPQDVTTNIATTYQNDPSVVLTITWVLSRQRPCSICL